MTWNSNGLMIDKVNILKYTLQIAYFSINSLPFCVLCPHERNIDNSFSNLEKGWEFLAFSTKKDSILQMTLMCKQYS